MSTYVLSPANLEAYWVIKSDLDSRFFGRHASESDPRAPRPAVSREAGDGSISTCRHLEPHRHSLVNMRLIHLSGCVPHLYRPPCRSSFSENRPLFEQNDNVDIHVDIAGPRCDVTVVWGGRNPARASQGVAFRHEKNAFRQIRRAGRRIRIGGGRKLAFAPLARV